jgi:phosphatidyl-myo-inositol dimannoside synthase
VPPEVEVVGLPHWSSAQAVVARSHRIIPAAVAIAARRVGSWDVVGAVVPSLVGTVFVTIARIRRRPVFLLIRGEKQRTLTWIMGRRWRTLPYLWALRAMEWPVRRWIAAGIPAFVAGEELVRRYQSDGASVYDLYPGVSRDFPIAAAPRAARQNGSGPLQLVTVARLSGEKGIAHLLEAMATLGGEGVELRLTAAGAGPERERLGRLAARLGIDDRVRFAGFVPPGSGLVELLDAADVFVLPSLSEGLPHSVVEAMARGLPAVATRVGGLPELLAGGAGPVVPPGDPAALAAALRALHADPDARALMSARALETARRFEPERVLDEFCARLGEAYPELGPLA